MDRFNAVVILGDKLREELSSTRSSSLEEDSFYKDLYFFYENAPAHFLLVNLDDQDLTLEELNFEKFVRPINNDEIIKHLKVCDLFIVIGSFRKEKMIEQYIEFLPLDAKNIFIGKQKNQKIKDLKEQYAGELRETLPAYIKTLNLD